MTFLDVGVAGACYQGIIRRSRWCKPTLCLTSNSRFAGCLHIAGVGTANLLVCRCGIYGLPHRRVTGMCGRDQVPQYKYIHCVRQGLLSKLTLSCTKCKTQCKTGTDISPTT